MSAGHSRIRFGGQVTTGLSVSITVQDTLKPVVTCPPNRILECPADISTNANGVASAQDACSAVTIGYSDVTNNNCAGTKMITRTWTATDDCGNSASCV